MYESIALNLILLLTGIAAVIGVLRPVVLWYWKVTRTVSLLEEHADQNRYIIDLLLTQNKQTATLISLLQAQTAKPVGQQPQGSPEQSGILDKAGLS